MPVVTPKPVRTSKNAKDMLRYDVDNENETIRNYRERIPQCESLEVPDLGRGPKRVRIAENLIGVIPG